MFRVAALYGLVGGDCEDDLAPDVGMIALGRTHSSKEQADGDLARKIVDELERFRLAYAVERAVGNLNRRGNDVLDVLAGESGLAQRPQAVVTWRIGRSERRAGAPRKLVDHISFRGRERFPVARRLHDVVVAGEDPELAAFAPVTGILLAQDFVVRKGIGIDGRGVEIECVHREARKSRLILVGRGYHEA